MNNEEKASEPTLAEIVEKKKQEGVSAVTVVAAKILEAMQVGSDDATDFWRRIAKTATTVAESIESTTDKRAS